VRVAVKMVSKHAHREAPLSTVGKQPNLKSLNRGGCYSHKNSIASINFKLDLPSLYSTTGYSRFFFVELATFLIAGSLFQSRPSEGRTRSAKNSSLFFEPQRYTILNEDATPDWPEPQRICATQCRDANKVLA
jgi:hypothetical protein